MSGKLPANFDPNWYGAAYLDVALSGLSPQQHYLRFGRLLGRMVSAPPAPAAESAAPTTPGRADRRESWPVSTEVAQPPPKTDLPPPIIDRPEGFDPAEALPQPAPPRSGGATDGTIGLDAIAVPAPGSAVEQSAIEPALHAYARLVRLPVPVEASGSVSCGAAVFQAGPARIENAWLADPSRLRLMLAGGNAELGPVSIRAYQADPGRPGDLRMLGEGVELPATGPVFHDVGLLHPLMPLLLELANGDGATRAIALLPFPSLLPGGLHSAELRAMQNEPNPMDAYWSLSELLLQETVGGVGWADRSVIAVAVDGDAPLMVQPVEEWLATVFDLAPEAGERDGFRLVLPPASVPTISALASRRLDQGEQTSVSGPYLIAEAGSYRPRWSIALPADQPGGSIPLLRPTDAKKPVAPATRLAPVHLAIALRSPHAPSTLARATADDTSPSVVAEALTVVLSGSDAARLEGLIQSIRAATNGEVDFIVRTRQPSDELRGALDRACEGQGWAAVPPGAELREIARGARHDILLTISDRVSLGDCTLPALLELLERDENAGSASCALLSEKTIKNQVVLQPAVGGLFPTGVSFASAPRLSFGEPDVLQALPGLAYPVVANALLLTVWRAGALAALRLPSGPVAAAGEDIRLGLDLMQAGYRNWCTTQVTARLSGPYTPRDMIDPVGAAYLQPERWEELLGRVAVVRELF